MQNIVRGRKRSRTWNLENVQKAGSRRCYSTNYSDTEDRYADISKDGDIPGSQHPMKQIECYVLFILLIFPRLSFHRYAQVFHSYYLIYFYTWYPFRFLCNLKANITCPRWNCWPSDYWYKQPTASGGRASKSKGSFYTLVFLLEFMNWGKLEIYL